MWNAAGTGVFGPRVLTIHNGQAMLERLCDELRWGGYLVKSVHSAHEAVLVAHSFLPDLFLADLVLPAIDAVAAAVEIKEWDPQCEVLLLVADSALATRQLRGLEAGGCPFRLVRRPVHAAELRHELDLIFRPQQPSRLAS